MDPQKIVPQSPNSKYTLSKKVLLTSTLIVVAAVLVVAGWYLLKPSKNGPVGAAGYTYKNLASYTTPDFPAGQKISFQKPVELSQNTSSAGQVTLIHLLSPTRQASFISAGISALGSPLTTSQTSALSKILADPQSPYYKASISAAWQFVYDRAPAGAVVTLGNAHVFSSANVKTAWQFSVTVMDSSKKLQGEEVFATSPKAYHYFLIVTPDYNWQANQAIWNRVFASLKIDQ